MPPDSHVDPAEEPSSTSAPIRPTDPAADDSTVMPGVLRDPASRVRIQSRVIRIGRRPDNDIIMIGHTALRLSVGQLIEYIDDGRSPKAGRRRELQRVPPNREHADQLSAQARRI